MDSEDLIKFLLAEHASACSQADKLRRELNEARRVCVVMRGRAGGGGPFPWEAGANLYREKM